MFLTRSEYDRGVNTFSPEGRLFQVEYAIEAVKLGSTSIGIKTIEGVLLAAEKRSTSKLMVNDVIEKISKRNTKGGWTDPDQPRNFWKTGQITEAKPSTDGVLREVVLRTKYNKFIKRPINLITPLEMDVEEESDEEKEPQQLQRTESGRYNLRERKGKSNAEDEDSDGNEPTETSDDVNRSNSRIIVTNATSSTQSRHPREANARSPGKRRREEDEEDVRVDQGGRSLIRSVVTIPARCPPAEPEEVKKEPGAKKLKSQGPYRSHRVLAKKSQPNPKIRTVCVADVHGTDKHHCSCHMLNLIIAEFAKLAQVKKYYEPAQGLATHLAKNQEHKRCGIK
ncbi:unnamed protein product [Caenorhabditis sp. 36 PRJEB53466]|nr:unnamed protein product [Caenorhabditis sp. 36 PRJEB53466]